MTDQGLRLELRARQIMDYMLSYTAVFQTMICHLERLMCFSAALQGSTTSTALFEQETDNCDPALKYIAVSRALSISFHDSFKAFITYVGHAVPEYVRTFFFTTFLRSAGDFLVRFQDSDYSSKC